MLVKNLINDNQVNEIVLKILSQSPFKKRCVEIVKDVCSDNKIDSNDIFRILNLVIVVYKNKSNIKIKKNLLDDVLKLLIYRLLEELKNENYDLDLDNLKGTIDFAVSVSVGLINITIDSNIFSKICNLFKNCFNNNSEEQEILNRVKRNNENNEVKVNDVVIENFDNNLNVNANETTSADNLNVNANETTSADNLNVNANETTSADNSNENANETTSADNSNENANETTSADNSNENVNETASADNSN
jgi:hypothetical protein